ncbi:MAG TPA: hypothetical protein VNR39_19510 [Pseudolabrys sp.]|nr:hypothetical protein [Pseudolabrys sp.]
MAKKAKRTTATRSAAKSKGRKKSASKKAGRAKKTKVAAPRARRLVSVSTVAAERALSVGEKEKISAQVLACIRGYVNDPQARYNTDLRKRYSWDSNNFIQLADDLRSCFSAAGTPLPGPISKPDLAKCDTIEDVCDIVIAVYK